MFSATSIIKTEKAGHDLPVYSIMICNHRAKGKVDLITIR